MLWAASDDNVCILLYKLQISYYMKPRSRMFYESQYKGCDLPTKYNKRVLLDLSCNILSGGSLTEAQYSEWVEYPFPSVFGQKNRSNLS